MGSICKKKDIHCCCTVLGAWKHISYEVFSFKNKLIYSGVQIRWQRVFWAGNQGIHQNFDKSFLIYKWWLIFIRMKKKIQNGRLKKRSFSSSANSQYFFMKISWTGPWVSRIGWCEGHWCCLTYMVVRLSDIRSKTAQKCLFCVFRPFLSLCRTASRPYRLSQTNALRINQSY